MSLCNTKDFSCQLSGNTSLLPEKPFSIKLCPCDKTKISLHICHISLWHLLPHHFVIPPMREKCPNTELFLACIFLYSDWIRRFTEYISVFSPNTGQYGPEITPDLDTFRWKSWWISCSLRITEITICLPSFLNFWVFSRQKFGS